MRTQKGLVRAVAAFLCACAAGLAWADPPSSLGLSGLINMPSGAMEPDGTFTVGGSHQQPYTAYYGTLQVLPDLQVSGRYTRIAGVAGFADPNTSYGDYKDKAAGFKARVLRQGSFGLRWLPDVSVGMDDIQGTRIFRSEFIAATQTFDVGSWGRAQATVGYGRHRIDGLYGGVRFTPSALPNWALVAEYDRTDYSHDTGALATGVADRRPGAINTGLEYTWGALHLQAMHGRYGNAFNISLSIPLEKREFVPKVDENGPFAGGAWFSAAPRPTAQMWLQDRQYRENLLTALQAEGLRSVRMAYRDGVLSLSVAGSRYRYPSRAVGRAARLAMAYAPLDTHMLEITWDVNGVAGMTWTFFDVRTLDRYLSGTATRAELAQSVTLSYADPRGRTAASRANDLDVTLDSVAAERSAASRWGFGLGRFDAESAGHSSFTVAPTFSAILNDPDGIFKYDLGAQATAKLHVKGGLWLEGAVGASILENVSDLKRPSNSALPHVRSDLAQYRQASRFKVDRLLVNQYLQPAERVYARLSGGLYEEMYGGVGGQVLYLAPGGRWAFDLSVDELRQRDYKGTGFFPYRVLTALGAAHYRVPGLQGVTATVRAGRFLAGDTGARLELSRTFKSGIEVGLWYTRTNGNDITSPGSPGHPYFDKGVFVNIPLGTMLTRDNGAVAGFTLSPWNRDVGQMVNSPGDLYQMVQRGWMDNVLDGDGLREFSDVPTEDRP